MFYMGQKNPYEIHKYFCNLKHEVNQYQLSQASQALYVIAVKGWEFPSNIRSIHILVIDLQSAYYKLLYWMSYWIFIDFACCIQFQLSIWVLSWGKHCSKVKVSSISFEGIIIIIHKCRSVTNEKSTIDSGNSRNPDVKL